MPFICFACKKEKHGKKWKNSHGKEKKVEKLRRKDKKLCA